jgi:CheY-like chemotaxis protein
MAQVLVVDADDREAQGIRAALEAEGHSVTVASGGEAWDWARLGRPEVVVLDDVPTARDLARHLGEAYPDLPLILLAAARDRSGRARDERPPPPSVVRVLERPVAAEALAAEVSSVVHEAHPAGREHRP